MAPPRIVWPNGARFAFTVFDDTDYHNASDYPSTRGATIAALDRFRDLFGADPRIGADHSGNREAMYWGARRFSGYRSRLYDLGQRFLRPTAGSEPFSGEEPASPYFWGDVLAYRVEYWRSFTFAGANVLRACPALPYHDPCRPFVPWWFVATHAPTLEPFLALLDPARLDRLEAGGGLCIAYTRRRDVRRALRNGIEVEAVDPLDPGSFAAEYHGQVCEAFATRDLTPVYGVDRVESLVDHLGRTGRLVLLRARTPDGEPAATGIFPGLLGSTAEFWMGTSHRRHQNLLRPSSARQSNSILKARSAPRSAARSSPATCESHKASRTNGARLLTRQARLAVDC